MSARLLGRVGNGGGLNKSGAESNLLTLSEVWFELYTAIDTLKSCGTRGLTQPSVEISVGGLMRGPGIGRSVSREGVYG